MLRCLQGLARPDIGRCARYRALLVDAGGERLVIAMLWHDHSDAGRGRASSQDNTMLAGEVKTEDRQDAVSG
jgi:hypothetical protein